MDIISKLLVQEKADPLNLARLSWPYDNISSRVECMRSMHPFGVLERCPHLLFDNYDCTSMYPPHSGAIGLSNY